MLISTRPAETSVTALQLRHETYSCRFGIGRLVTQGDLPLEVELPGAADSPEPMTVGDTRWARLLERYFAGERVDFDLDVTAYAAVADLSAFDRDVYTALVAVPYGSVVSYRDLATMAGRPRAYRAVGSAMARNRLPVIVPCHRVVRNDGTLGQYGSDPAWKARLLTLEGISVKEGRLA